MPLSTVPALNGAENYLQIRPLPLSCQPAMVVRWDGATIVAIDPATTCREVAEWAPDNLTVDEMNAYRAAYGEPPVGQPLSDEWQTDEPIPAWVPACLFLPSSQPTAVPIPESRTA